MSARIPAHEHPTVWAYVGEGRYLQAAFSRSRAELYAEQFGTTTLKSLSNIAAKGGHENMLPWCRDVGCVWDKSLYVSGAAGGSTAVMNWLLQNGCPLPSNSKDVCEAAAGADSAGVDSVAVLQWLYEKGLWYKHAGSTAARGGNLPAVKWQIKQNKAKLGSFGEERRLKDLCLAACKGGHVQVLRWLKKRGCPWDVELCVKAALRRGRLRLVQWFHARNLLPLNEKTIFRAIKPFHLSLEGQGKVGLHTLTDFLFRVVHNRTRLDEFTCMCAAASGSLALLITLRVKGCPWDGNVLEIARLFSEHSENHKHVEEWAMANGCPELTT